MSLKHIKSFGVELEGLFLRTARARVFDGMGYVQSSTDYVLSHTHGDGSVAGSFPNPNGSNIAALYADDDDDDDSFGCDCGEDDCSYCNPSPYDRRSRRDSEDSLRSNETYRTAEWSSPPIYPDQFPQWRDHIKSWWPHSVNSTCGMHCHLGLRHPRDYARIIDLGSVFTNDLVRTLAREFLRGQFSAWPEREIAVRRFEGHNQYCRVPTDSGFALRQFLNGDDRYTAVNFSAFRSHGTIELRVLPAILHPDRGIALLDYAMNFTDDYLATKGRALIRVERKPIAVTVEEDLIVTSIERSL